MNGPPFPSHIPQLGEVRQEKSSPQWGATVFSRGAIIPAMGNTLKSLREQRSWTHQKAADEMGISRGQFIKLERGERRLTDRYIAMAAKTFGVPAISIMEVSAVPIVGKIGAGGRIETRWEQQTEPLFEVEFPFPLRPDAIGFEVSGESMYPVFNDGDIVVVSRNGEPVENLIGQDAAIATSEGDRFFKTIMRGGSAGLFDLESYNAPPMRNMAVQWASGLIARVPASQWRHLNGHK